MEQFLALFTGDMMENFTTHVERHRASHAGIRASLMIMETVKIVATCL
jgi:hypothetical protein